MFGRWSAAKKRNFHQSRGTGFANIIEGDEVWALLASRTILMSPVTWHMSFVWWSGDCHTGRANVGFSVRLRCAKPARSMNLRSHVRSLRRLCDTANIERRPMIEKLRSMARITESSVSAEGLV